MKIPTIPKERLVDEKGYITPVWEQTLIQLFSQLQQNASEEGLITPQQPTDNINKLSTQQSIGAIVYDSKTDKFMACKKKVVGSTVTGEFKEIQLL